MPQFRNLVFEGGGVKGIAYSGAVAALEAHGILEPIIRVGGTSAGAIASSLLACGTSVGELGDMLEETPFNSFTDRGFGYIRATKRLLSRYGWYKGERFSEWMRGNLAAACGDADITFKQLYERHLKQPEQYRRLFIIGTNLSRQRSEVFSHISTPDMPIWLAVRISMSIPLFFQSVLHNGDIYVDGGVTWNFPINVFDEAQFMTSSYSRDPAATYNRETLGLRVASRLPELGEPIPQPEPIAINGIRDYMITLINYVWETVNRQHLFEHDWQRMIFIDTTEFSPIDFNLQKSEIDLLIERGHAGVNRYFEWFNNANNRAKNRI